MIHPDTEVRFISLEIGRGVFATRPIPKGTVTWVFDPLDRVLPPAEVDCLPPMVRDILIHYSYRNRDGHFVFCWDHTKYVNHRFDANCLLTAYGLEVAVQDIAAGEEITNDYGCLNIIEPFEPHPEDTGRGIICPDDLGRCAPEWDARILEAIRRLPHTEQPLQPLVPTATWAELLAVAEGRISPRSVEELLCRE